MNVAALFHPQTERAFQAEVIRLAEMLGWRCYHTFDSRRSRGGFPDLVLIRRPRVVVAEIKSERGKATHEQIDWLAAFDECGIEAYIWRPSSFRTIEKVLAR